MSPLTWWKGIRLHTKADSNYWKVVAETQDSQTPVVAMFQHVNLFTQDLVLWKAKVRPIVF